MQAQFGILGPLEAVVDGRRVDLGGAKPRRLLAALLVHLGEVVSVDRLVDALWDDALPGSAEVTLRAHVAGLRRALPGAGVEGIVVCGKEPSDGPRRSLVGGSGSSAAG